MKVQKDEESLVVKRNVGSCVETRPSVRRLREDETFPVGNAQRVEHGENTMEYIYFEGGDKHGSTLDIEGDLSGSRLLFDGSPRYGSPQGEYARTETTILIAGVERTIWQLVVSQTQ